MTFARSAAARTAEPRRTAAPKTLILFDLDGVLLDSRSNMAHAWETVRSELGVQPMFEDYFAEIGRPFQDIMSRLGLANQAGRIEQVFRRASGETLSDSPFYPGAIDMLTELSANNQKLGIVTSKDGARTTLVLDRLPVTFAVVKSPDLVCRGKPAPDSLLMAMAECNVDPDNTVFVGDMVSDATAAARAHVDYVHAAWGYGEAPPKAAFVAADCAALFAFLTR